MALCCGLVTLPLLSPRLSFKLKSISHCWGGFSFQRLSAIIPIGESKQEQATVHIPCLVATLPGNVELLDEGSSDGSFFPLWAAPSPSLSVPQPPTSPLSVPLLFCILIGGPQADYKPGDVKLIINILGFVLRSQGRELYGSVAC